MSKRYNPTIKIKIKGADKLIAKLKRLGNVATAKKVVRAATSAATTPLLRAVRDEIPVDSGALKKSMAKKITGKNFHYNGIVGSDKAKMMPDGDPVEHHLHLIEFGFEHVGGKVIAGQHPLEKGFEASRAQCQATYERKLAEGIEREAAKG